MKLHFPTFGYILRLFFTPTDVDSIVSGVTRQVKALEDSVLHHQAKADKHQADADLHFTLAGESINMADDHAAQADRAERVATNLAALVA